MPASCGMPNVRPPKIALRFRCLMNSKRSISNPARNMMYNSPIVPRSTMVGSRSSTPREFGPRTMPATSSTTDEGMPRRPSSGAARSTSRTTVNTATGSLSGRDRSGRLNGVISGQSARLSWAITFLTISSARDRSPGVPGQSIAALAVVAFQNAPSQITIPARCCGVRTRRPLRPA